MPPEDLLDLFAIDPAAKDAPAPGRPEPLLPAGPMFVEFTEPERLDPARATAAPEPPPPTPVRRWLWLAGLAGSIGVHLLPLLLLLAWRGTALELPQPIPVKLIVLEEPPPPPPLPPPPKPEEAKPPPLGRLANVDIGDPKGKPEQPAAATPAPDQPEEKPVAAEPPRPKPTPPRDLVSALHKPAPAPQAELKPPEPEQAPLVKPPVREAVAALPPTPRPPVRHQGQIPGPDATRDEYLAYCMSLVRQHYGLLPPSFLAGRRGATAINILVLGDGSIARIEIVQHSGYSDIDSRVEQMIAAVHRFPPLPQWIQRTSITMTYELAFPEGLLER